MNTCGISFELMQRMAIPVVRENRITWAEGIPYSDRKTDFEVRGIIFPLNGRDLLLVPEGDRYSENVWVYTQGDIKVNDLLIYNGAPFEVQNVQNWDSYRQGRAMRMDTGDLGNQ